MTENTKRDEKLPIRTIRNSFDGFRRPTPIDSETGKHFFGVDFVFRAAMFPALYLVLIALAVILVISVIKSSVRPSNFPPGELKTFFLETTAEKLNLGPIL